MDDHLLLRTSPAQRTEAITLRLSKQLLSKLDALARQAGISRSAALRLMIQRARPRRVTP